jgi:membrane-associated phospholipid phosphatase
LRTSCPVFGPGPPASGSFQSCPPPSSHTAVTLAVAIALVPFLARPLAAVGIGYAVLVGWSRVYLGVHYPLDALAGAGIGMAAGDVIVLAAGTLLRRAGRAANSHNAATEVQARGADPEPPCGSKERPEPR